MMTLDEFLADPGFLSNLDPLGLGNAWVKEPGFKGLYVRKTKRLWHKKLVPCVDLANVTVSKPGKGTFTRLVARLHARYNLCVECVTSEQFERGLTRRGFVKLPDQGGFPSYFLSKRMKLRE